MDKGMMDLVVGEALGLDQLGSFVNNVQGIS